MTVGQIAHKYNENLLKRLLLLFLISTPFKIDGLKVFPEMEGTESLSMA